LPSSTGLEDGCPAVGSAQRTSPEENPNGIRNGVVATRSSSGRAESPFAALTQRRAVSQTPDKSGRTKTNAQIDSNFIHSLLEMAQNSICKSPRSGDLH
jgi:hypothetical protein